jgi:copper transport protein
MPLPGRFRRLIVVALASLLLPTPARAAGYPPRLHTALKRAEPAVDSRLTVAPTRISLWFTAKPQRAFSRIRLSTSAGDIALDSVVADTGHSLHARIPRALSPGRYRVIWQTASADGHPIRGEYAFTVLPLAGSAGVDTPRSPAVVTHAPETRIDAGSHSEYRTARWIEFVALLTVLGALGFRHGVLPPLAARGVPTADAADRARRLGQSVLPLYAIATLVRLYTESAALNTPTDALDPGVLVPMLTSTIWGIGWLLGALGALFLLAGWAISKRSVGVGTPLALTGALGMVLSPALAGHAAASDNFIISVTLDMLHVAAAGVWLGGLLIVVLAGIPAMRRLTDGNPDAAVSALINSFHPIALFCAPIVVIAGLGTSWIRLGGPGALTTTQYGRTLLWKLGVFCVIAGLALYNSLRARKQLGTPTATTNMRRSGTIELVFAALLLAVTTALVAAPVPTDMVGP